jgi:hypothetical protein
LAGASRLENSAVPTALKPISMLVRANLYSPDIAKDLDLKAKITAKIIDKMGSDVFSLNTDVYEQDVMLTGAVENLHLKAMARSHAGPSRGPRRSKTRSSLSRVLIRTRAR